jgi:hypothetical protein
MDQFLLVVATAFKTPSLGGMMCRHDSIVTLCAGLLSLLLLTNSTAVLAQDDEVTGRGSLRLEYQFIRTGAFDSSIGDIDIGNTDGHTFLLSAEFALNDRWTLFASLPWISKRHQGALPHDPVNDITEWDPPDLTLVDDGDFHSDFQDLYVGVSYLAKSGALSLAPFVSYGLPTHNYPIYAHAAVGRNIWHVPVGVAWSYLPHFSDFYFSGDVAYVFSQKTLGVDISHWLINTTVSYYVTPSFAPKVFVSIKHGTEGLDWPDDYDITALNDQKWYYHDRMIKHNFINGGVGFDWILNDRYQLSGSWFTMLRPDQVNKIDYAYTLGMTWLW